MVKQYPHTISVTWKGPTTYDDNQNGIEGADLSFESKCRAEVNSGARKTPGVDGVLIDYAFTVFMPLTDVVIPFGAEFILNGNLAGTVKGSWNGQFNSKLWV